MRDNNVEWNKVFFGSAGALLGITLTVIAVIPPFTYKNNEIAQYKRALFQIEKLNKHNEQFGGAYVSGQTYFVNDDASVKINEGSLLLKVLENEKNKEMFLVIDPDPDREIIVLLPDQLLQKVDP
ncbi:MAG: hypothetical protein HYT37_00075 [Candidatus Sungbacteria bacterium]|nr:hypothetical protein [Candidatus Sungbacteria bacterium]